MWAYNSFSWRTRGSTHLCRGLRILLDRWSLLSSGRFSLPSEHLCRCFSCPMLLSLATAFVSIQYLLLQLTNWYLRVSTDDQVETDKRAWFYNATIINVATLSYSHVTILPTTGISQVRNILDKIYLTINLQFWLPIKPTHRPDYLECTFS